MSNEDHLQIADQVANMATRNRYLEKKSADDDAMIDLLKKQKDEMSEELTNAQHDFGIQMFQMQQERDAALRKAEDVQAIIETLGKLALSGVQRMKDIPAVESEVQTGDTQPPLIVKHLQASPARLPQVTPETPLPPRPTFDDLPPLFLRDGKKRQ